MCDLIICGGAALVIFGGGTAFMAYDVHKLNKNHNKKRLINKLDELTYCYSLKERNGEESPDKEKVFDVLGLGKGMGNWMVRRTIVKGQEARDRIIFHPEPPKVRQAATYLSAQKNLSKIDRRLLFVLEPGLFLNQASKKLLIDWDIEGCKDGSYSSSLEFAAKYLNIVGKEYFDNKRQRYLKKNNLPESNPWYFKRFDYRIMTGSSKRDSF